jgi:hypothetical protein
MNGSIYRVTDRPRRCSMSALCSSDSGPTDPREQRVVQPTVAPHPPTHLTADPESVTRARRSQREQRARALEVFYQSFGAAGFDRPFLDWTVEDPELVNELRGKAYARGAVLLSKTRSGQR